MNTVNDTFLRKTVGRLRSAPRDGLARLEQLNAQLADLGCRNKLPSSPESYRKIVGRKAGRQS